VFAVKRLRIVELCRGEKDRGGEFVGFLAVVFEVQPLVHAMLKVQMVRREPIVDYRDVDSDRLRGCGATGRRHGDQQAALDGVPFHS
jgi:hypothetical protein